jgi:RNA polymerase sigma factor (sigma-70 family)
MPLEARPLLIKSLTVPSKTPAAPALPTPGNGSMQATDPLGHDVSLSGEIARTRLRARLEDLRPEIGAEEWKTLSGLAADPVREAEALRDAISTRLMEIFRQNTGRGTFGLLYELNCQHLLVQVAGRLRRYTSKADPRDVLQEVFFNIYRYPHRFNAEREDAFRVWSAMIVRNTVLKHLRTLGRGGRSEVPFEDLSEQPEVHGASPLSGAIERESRTECARVYLTYLHLYLKFYGMLSERERAALSMVEVQEYSYRQAADELGIKLENLKMVIFRARRKIHRAMRRVFDGMSPDCRPAREPRLRTGDTDDLDDASGDLTEVDGHGI